MKVTNVKSFEDSRWTSFRQSVEFRHTAALELIKEGTVLDIGCGDGLFMSLLRKRGVTAVGVDISDEAVRACTAQGLSAEVIASADALPFPDAHFEYVVMLDILEHVYNPVLFLAEARRVSKKYVIVGVPNFSSLPARIQTLCGRVPENNRPKKGHVYWFNHPVLMSIAKQAALTPGRLKMNTFSPFTVMNDWVTHIWPNLFALSFVLELQK
ncbi:MAG: methionine biosynthesis protein MetW [Patescibacteria group bacterium]